ncbi:hypothetical protein WMY93_017984 [Mugilogobius chulae]|uniref:Mot1 central domain-containing protein n=1 Tax=Mugilogobius chulae TaxID=88201 RepID=A0AAW0NST9_9GOBI
MLLEVKARSKDKSGVKARQGGTQVKETVQEYIAGAETVTDDSVTRDYVVVRARLMAAKLLGALCRCICDPQLNSSSQEMRPAESLGQLLLFHLNSKSALQRIAVALVLCEWAALQKVTSIFSESTSGLNPKSKQWQCLDSKRQQAQSTVLETNNDWQQLHLRVHMFTACAVINLQVLPDKLNPLVRPLMETIKREENTLIQGYAASFIAKLLQQCAGRSPCPNPKIIKNLCVSACVDSLSTPSSACPVPPTQDNAKEQKTFSDSERGAEFSLTTISKHFGADLTQSLPYLWENTVGPLRSVVTDNHQINRSAQLERGDAAAQDWSTLSSIRSHGPGNVHRTQTLLLELLAHLFTCLQHPYTAVRHMAARCVGVLCKISMLQTMNSFLERVLPWLAAIDDCTKQEGAIEALACILLNTSSLLVF